MTTILVIDATGSYYLEFFRREFSRNRIDLRIVETIEEAKYFYESTHFTYIFIGDVEDIGWMNTSKMVDKNIHSIVLYSQNSDLVAKQKAQIPSAFIMPFPSLSTFIDLEEIKIIEKRD